MKELTRTPQDSYHHPHQTYLREQSIAWYMLLKKKTAFQRLTRDCEFQGILDYSVRLHCKIKQIKNNKHYLEIIFIFQKGFINNRAGKMVQRVILLATQTWQPEVTPRSHSRREAILKAVLGPTRDP